MTEFRVQAISGGLSYEINRVKNFAMTSWSGLGQPNTNRLSERSPFQQGDTDLGFRVFPRTFTFSWELTGKPLTAWELYELRTEMLGIFRPRQDDPVELRFHLPNKTIRASIVNLDGDILMPSSDRVGYATQRVGCVLKANDPRLFDPEQKVVDIALLASPDGWPIPWPIPWPIGLSTVNIQETILYANGSIHAEKEFPVIRLFGPISNPIIENVTTGESIPLNAQGGLSLSLGEFVEIDLSFDKKTIIDQTGNPVDQFLATDNDLATWHLSYNTEKLNNGSRSDGNNIIRVSGLNATTNTRLTLNYFDRFVGA